ncbi:MAG: hypothetical protein AAGI69_15730 [Cyanobacteria bacterium P01_H01_bin.21]
MVNLNSLESSKSLFNEVAIANFGPFQIAVLTATNVVERPIFSAHIPVPERTYQPQGWLIHNQQIVAHLDSLKINPIFSPDGPFRQLCRLAPAVPVSFEVNSSQILPAQVAKQATFVCEFPGAYFPCQTIFHHISPHFVRIYPFKQQTDLLRNTKQLLKDEVAFIMQNREQLKKLTFFQKRFRL